MKITSSLVALGFTLATVVQGVAAFTCPVSGFGEQEYGFCCSGIDQSNGFGQNCLSSCSVFRYVMFQCFWKVQSAEKLTGTNTTLNSPLVDVCADNGHIAARCSRSRFFVSPLRGLYLIMNCSFDFDSVGLG